MMLELAMAPFVGAAPSAKNKPRSSSSSTARLARTALQGGQTMTVWGPQQIVRQSFPSTYTANFPLPAGAIAPYQLTISNGAPDGTRKVTSACVKLNGANVLSFTCNHSVNPSPQVRTVSLQANNTIQVSLIGPTLSYVTITITANQASLAASPNSGNQGQTLSVALTGTSTNWIAGQTTASFGGEITVDSFNVSSATSATAQITISPTAALGPRTITTTTGSEVVSGVDAFTVNAVTPPGPASSTVSTLAGSAGNPGFSDGTGSAARFRNLAGIAAGPNNVIYVADAGNHSIRAVDASGVVTTVAGAGIPGFYDDQGTFAEFNNPQGVAVDSSGNIYVADTGNHSIRKIDTSGNVTTLAGDGTSGFVNDTGSAARFNSPRGVAIDTLGRIYVADTGNHAVRQIDANGAVTTVAGDGTTGSNNSPNARFNGLAGITADGDQIYVYVADTNNHRIRRLDQVDTVITLAGLDRGFKDGTAAESRFADPVGVAVDGAGHIIVAETTNSLVREIDPARAINGDPNAVYTLAGTGERGSTDGAGNIAKFNKPSGVAVTTSGAVIVADTGGNTLRKILLPPIVATLNPTQGSVGTSVTITGNRFDERGPSYNTVRFTASGGGTVTATVTSATRTQIDATVPAGAVTGSVSVQTAGGTGTSPGFFTVLGGAPMIADFNPKTGPVGTIVTITGSSLKSGAVDPVVTFQGPNSTRLSAQINSATPTQVVVVVPTAAVTGVIDLTTSGGVAQTANSFFVQSTQDYALVLKPSSKTMTQGGNATYVVSATSPQASFTQLIKLSVSGLPAGIQSAFAPAQITAGSDSTLTLTIPDNLSPTTYSFTVQGLASIDGAMVSRTVGGSLTVMSRNGQTILSGRVLDTDEKPIEGALVAVGGASGMTDAAGDFFIPGVAPSPPGQSSKVLINATNIPGPPPETYPIISEPAVIVAGQANVVPYIFYLPKIDWADSGVVNGIQVDVNGNVASTVTVTNTKIPNLEMTILAGTKIVGRNGSAITRASLTPVPIDRVPAPLPATFQLSPGNTINIATQLVYTSQPGSACVGTLDPQTGQCVNNGQVIPVTYPNLGGAAPGTTVPLFKYDHEDLEWIKYGDGTVSSDGKKIVPNAGVGLTDFAWHFPFLSVGQDPNDPDCGNYLSTPVDLSTGHKLEVMTDIAFGGARGGLSLTRIFTNDLSNPSSPVTTRFGHGASDNYNIRLVGSFNQGGFGRVVMPDQIDGRLFTYSGLDTDGAWLFKSISTISQLGDVVRRTTGGVFEYRTRNGAVLRFEPNGPNNYRLKTVVDRNGNTTTLSYTGNDLASVTDAVGRTLTFTYVTFGGTFRYVDSVTDPLGRVTRYYYEYKTDTARWLLRSVIDPMGFTTSYTYNRYNWINSVKDARGNFVKRIEYYYVEPGIDPRNNGKVRWQIFADGQKQTYEYSYAGQVVTGVKMRSYPSHLPDTTPDSDPLVRVETRRFNARGYLIGAIDALGQQAVIERRIEDNVPTKTIGQCGCSSSEVARTFDDRGNSLTVTNQLSNTVSFQYHPQFNWITQLTLPSTGDGLIRQTNFSYDSANGNLLSITNALGDTTAFGYDPSFSSLLKTITTPATATQPASTTTLNYDAYGFLRERLDPLGHKITFEYDIVGRLKKVTDHIGRYTEFVYDDSDRLIEVKAPDTDPATGDFRQSSTIYGYDENGNRTLATDPFGKQWRMTYDAKNRPETMTDPINRVTRWFFNTEDELVKVVTPSGRTMGYEYDKRGQRTKMTDGLGNAVTLGYDAYGQLQTVQDQRGYTTTFTYDRAHRPQTRRDPTGRVATVEYDAIGNARVATDRLGRRIEIDYDKLNRPQQTRYNDATVNYGYDAKGRWTSIGDAASTISWEYDLANRLTKETTPQGAVEYLYWDDDQRKTLKVNGSVQSEYEYDNAGRLQRIRKGAEQFVFGYDKLSRRTSLQRPNFVTTSYEYDDVQRLKRLTHSGGSMPEDLQYEYTLDDEIAKITSAYGSTQLPQNKTIAAADAANRIPTHNGANQVFDNEGQTTNSGANVYQWDARGRLTQATASGQTVGYGYDALGRRVSRTDASGTMTFQYDGADVVMDRQGAATTDYVNGMGIDEKLRMGTSSGASYFQQDHLGSVIGLTGVVNERRNYEAFGADGGSGATRYGYTGRERDAATGLLYYRARWYDAGQGRFLSEDPIGMAGGPNLYSYVSNNPLSLIDPLGLKGWGAEEWSAFGSAAAEGFLLAAGFAFPLMVLAPVFPVAVAVIGGAMLLTGVISVAATISRWNTLCETDKAAFLGGLLGSTLGGFAGGGIGKSLGSPKVRPYKERINVGGGHEPDAYNSSNLNDFVSNTGGPDRGVPNLVKGNANEIAQYFKPGSANEILSRRLPYDTVNWDAFAQGAYRVMKSGGELDLNVWVMSTSMKN
ncbi:MAG: RHS repeat-associated core domain-containing protein [Blastocatellales bacterium]